MGCSIHNGGIGGTKFLELKGIIEGFVHGNWETIDQIINDLAVSYNLQPFKMLPYRYSVIKSIDLSKLDFIVIAYGTNDWTADTPIDNKDNIYDTTTSLGCLRYFVKEIQSLYPNIEIFVITPSYRVFTRDATTSEVLTDSDNVLHNSITLLS